MPYHGKDHNDYVNGAGFCCEGKDKKLQAYGGGIGKGNEEYEKMQYYYHADHLGSSSYITNLDAQIVQHVEYVPFGEVFIEERNQSWNTPYLFNGKELDEETGLYYYGARYYNPRESIFLSVDPMFEETMTPYQYTYQNPIKFTDPTGMVGEPKSNPDSFWHKLTWSKAHRNAERYANKMRYGNNKVDVIKHDSGDWAVFTDYNDGLKNRSTFSSKGMVDSQDYGVFVGDIDATLEGTNTTFTYPTYGSPSIGLPNPFQGKSQFDIVMVDTNPVMTSIASSVAPPLGFLAGGIETYVSARDGDYVGATYGAVMLGFSAKMSGPANQWFRGANNKFTLTPGNTYSRTLGQGTVGFKWGASPKYLNEIPNPGMQKINQMLRRTSLPVKDKLGLQEAGHFHLKTR